MVNDSTEKCLCYKSFGSILNIKLTCIKKKKKNTQKFSGYAF